MGTIDQVAEHLTTLGLIFQRVGDDGLEYIRISFNGENVPYHLRIDANDPLIVVAAPGLATVPPNRRDEVVRLANHLNATRLRLGCFFVDPTRQRLVFELPILAPEGPSRAQVQMAMAAAGAVDRYFPAFARVLWSGSSAEAALAEPAPADDGEGPSFDLAV